MATTISSNSTLEHFQRWSNFATSVLPTAGQQIIFNPLHNEHVLQQAVTHASYARCVIP